MIESAQPVTMMASRCDRWQIGVLVCCIFLEIFSGLCESLKELYKVESGDEIASKKMRT